MGKNPHSAPTGRSDGELPSGIPACSEYAPNMCQSPFWPLFDPAIPKSPLFGYCMRSREAAPIRHNMTRSMKSMSVVFIFAGVCPDC